jgi:aminopeptidase
VTATGPDPDAFAALLCDWCLEVAPGQQVLVAMPLPAFPLVRALHAALLDRGAWPLIRLSPAALAEDFYRHARDVHLDGFAPLELADVAGADATLVIQAPSNTRALAGIDPSLIARAARARKPIVDARLAGRWCGSIWPTAALAQQAGMGERDYAEFLAGALMLGRPDPLQAWRELSAYQQQLVERLSDAREIHVEAEGTDLRLSVDGRTWINSDGKRNMPSGEIFTGPIEDSAQGTIRFTVPASPGGVEVSGVQLTLERGEVVSASAQTGEDYLRSALATDDGARRLGELGIGCNRGIDRPTGTMLLDEKIAGTVHLALGRSYPETGARNVSALHWDLICDLRAGGRIFVDGHVFNENGRFVE